MKRTIGRIVILGLVAATIHAQADTYYLQSDGDHPAPYPFNIYGQLEPVMTLDANRRIYLVEDTAQDRADLQKFMNQTSGTMEPLDAPAPPGGGGTNTYTYTFTYQPPTNGLYLTWDGFSGGLADMTLHGGTGSVYVALSSTNLSTPSSQWNIAGEIFPTDTNAMPFTAEMPAGQSVFYNVEDWSDAMTNGLYDWWMYYWFGDLNESAAELDSTGTNTLGFDYTNGLDPNVISFSVQFTNTRVNVSSASGTLHIQGGRPFYEAVLVNDGNLADAVWQPYENTNLLVSLNAGDGNYDVWVGLRGLPTNATPTWEGMRLTLDTAPPVLTVTNPVGSAVSKPMIQIQGYTDESLSRLTFGVSNAIGVLTNQPGYVTSRFYDTNRMDYTTNFFQCYDVRLTNDNSITLRAVDLAGNVTVTNFNLTLDALGATNAPMLAIVWPANNASIGGTNVNIRAQTDD